jgi:hypothetical protein
MELFKSIWNEGVLPVTKFLEQYGFSVPVLLVVIFATWLTKLADKNRKNEARYVWLPFAYTLLMVVALDLVDKAVNAWLWPVATIQNGFMASGIYNVYAKTIKAKREAAKRAKGAM